MDNFVITLLKMCTMLFVVIDPIGNMPIFMSLTNSPRQGYRAEVAKRSVLIGFIVLIFFAFAGEAFLNSLQISLPAFRIAGGIMLFIVGLQMIFTNIEKPHADDGKDQLYGGVDVAVFPLAVPLIAGPGTIASIILMMSEARGKPIEQCSIIIALIAILILSYILFRLCDLFARLFGQTINNVISKILGIVLGALASQFVIDGIKALI
ncbi:MAG: MarC family protein [Alphaproteobacteria bacterium]|nr:MarC family protein [Alphaproteobacteria bacterium]